MTQQANQATKPAAKPSGGAKRTASKVDAVQLRDLAAQISAAGAQLGDLMAQMTSEQGLKIYEKPKGSGHYVARMCGIATSPAPGELQALRLWANKARRVALQEG